MSQRVLTAHVPGTLAREVDALARRLDRPRGWIVKEALASFVALEQKREALTREALAEVEAGLLSSHAEVEAWAAAATKPARTRRR